MENSNLTHEIDLLKLIQRWTQRLDHVVTVVLFCCSLLRLSGSDVAISVLFSIALTSVETEMPVHEN